MSMETNRSGETLTIFADSSPLPAGRRIRLDTAAGMDIENWQGSELTLLDRKQCANADASFTSALESRGEPTPVYNCHGMSFASRRTRIWQQSTIMQILREDKYVQICDPAMVLPGDLILYYAPDGEVEHSGIVLTRPSEGAYGYPRIVSKWGHYREVVHYANICEYSLQDIRYYRVMHG